MNTTSETPTATTAPAEALTSATLAANAEAVRSDDQTDRTMIVLRNDLHWLRIRLAIAAASAAALVLVRIYWPAAHADAEAKSLPAVTFQTKTLVDAAGRSRERDARLLLQDGKVIVTPKDTDRAVRVLSFGDVRSISYSHGRDPLWSSPTGPAVVTRPGASGLERIGIGVRRHWIALETGAAAKSADRFVVLQVAEQSVRPILSALQDRTGLTPQTVAER